MSWDQLRVILAEARDRRAEEDAAPPESCPNDGEPLTEHNGVLHCKHDGYTWP